MVIIIYQIYYKKKENKRWLKILQSFSRENTARRNITYLSNIKAWDTEKYDFKVKKI